MGIETVAMFVVCVMVVLVKIEVAVLRGMTLVAVVDGTNSTVVESVVDTVTV